jgi:hypothetical protein
MNPSIFLVNLTPDPPSPNLRESNQAHTHSASEPLFNDPQME